MEVHDAHGLAGLGDDQRRDLLAGDRTPGDEAEGDAALAGPQHRAGWRGDDRGGRFGVRFRDFGNRVVSPRRWRAPEPD